jgi:hypothetical protein
LFRNKSAVFSPPSKKERGGKELPGKVECTDISKLVSSTGSLSMSSFSLAGRGVLKYIAEVRSTKWMSQKIRRTHSLSIEACMNSGDGTGVNVGMSGLCTPRLSTICRARSGSEKEHPYQFA